MIVYKCIQYIHILVGYKNIICKYLYEIVLFLFFNCNKKKQLNVYTIQHVQKKKIIKILYYNYY